MAELCRQADAARGGAPNSSVLAMTRRLKGVELFSVNQRQIDDLGQETGAFTSSKSNSESRSRTPIMTTTLG